MLHSIRSRILLALLVPSLSLLGLAGWLVHDRLQRLHQADSVQAIVGYAVASSSLMHELQKERGSTALFVGSGGKQFGRELQVQRAQTDAARLRLETVLHQQGDLAERPDFHAAVQAGETALAPIAETRRGVDALALPAHRAFGTYTTAILRQLDTVQQAIHATTNPQIILATQAYYDLLLGKELAGQERGLAAGAFAAGRFEPDVYRRVIALAALQDQTFEDAARLANPDVAQTLRRLQEDTSQSGVANFRRIAYDSVYKGDTGNVAAPAWFSAMSSHIDHLRQVEVAMSADLLDMAGAARRQALQQSLLAGGAIAVLLLATGLIGWFLVRSITRPLGALTGTMRQLASGDLSCAVPALTRRDELGAMAQAVQFFKQNAVEKVELERNAAEQRAKTDQARRDREAREAAAATEIAALCESIADGDLSGRLEEMNKEGFLLVLSQRLNQLVTTLHGVTDELADCMTAMSGGDLTQVVGGDYRGVFGDLKAGANGMAGRLTDLAARLANNAATVRDAASEISAGSADLAQRTESQAASLEQTAASMHEVTATVKHNADNAQAASQLAMTARGSAEQGGKVVREAVAAVRRIEDSAQKITDIVSLIDEIAFQTNLLALNASVEAARAGEAGKGFAVVAQEVRALAQRSANASKDIKALIVESTAHVKTGAQLVDQTGLSLAGIVDAVARVSDIIAEIAAASREQASGLEQVNTAVGQMDEMTQRNGALVEQTSASAQALAGQAHDLAELVGFFRTGPVADRLAANLRRAA